MPPGAAPPRPHVTAPKARRLALGKLSPDVFPIYFNNAADSERLARPRILFDDRASRICWSTAELIGDSFAPSEESGLPF
jgi:hypothetical protein